MPNAPSTKALQQSLQGNVNAKTGETTQAADGGKTGQGKAAGTPCKFYLTDNGSKATSKQTAQPRRTRSPEARRWMRVLAISSRRAGESAQVLEESCEEQSHALR